MTTVLDSTCCSGHSHSYIALLFGYPCLVLLKAPHVFLELDESSGEDFFPVSGAASRSPRSVDLSRIAALFGSTAAAVARQLRSRG